ncbi:MAG: glycosyltransferase family 4 protein [Candidatus Altiarchaeota archaeon]
MKIAVTLHQITRRGGICKVASALIDRFVEEHEVHLITARITTPIEGLIVHKTPLIWKPMFMEIGSAVYFNTTTANRLRRQIGFDVVHSHGAEMLGPDVITAHSCHKAAIADLEKHRGCGYGLMKRLEPMSNIVLAVERHNYAGGNYRKIISVSQGVKREIMRLYGVPDEDITVIPNGVDLQEFNPENRGVYSRETREKLGISMEDTVLMTTSWEYKRKGLRHIVDALPLTPEDVKLMVVGRDDEGPYRRQAEKLGVKDRLIFAGTTSDIRRYYAAADIFVFPTSYEAFSLATLEAAASGLPLLTTKVNGTEELVKDGYNGHFIERDGTDIAEKIGWLADRGIRRMGEQSRKTAESYSWDDIAERTLGVYEEVSRN